MGVIAKLRSVDSRPPTVPDMARAMRARCRCAPPGCEMLLPRLTRRTDVLRRPASCTGRAALRNGGVALHIAPRAGDAHPTGCEKTEGDWGRQSSSNESHHLYMRALLRPGSRCRDWNNTQLNNLPPVPTQCNAAPCGMHGASSHITAVPRSQTKQAQCHV